MVGAVFPYASAAEAALHDHTRGGWEAVIEGENSHG
jgi:hypothetical protein